MKFPSRIKEREGLEAGGYGGVRAQLQVLPEDREQKGEFGLAAYRRKFLTSWHVSATQKLRVSEAKNKGFPD